MITLDKKYAPKITPTSKEETQRLMSYYRALEIMLKFPSGSMKPNNVKFV